MPSREREMLRRLMEARRAFHSGPMTPEKFAEWDAALAAADALLAEPEGGEELEVTCHGYHHQTRVPFLTVSGVRAEQFQTGQRVRVTRVHELSPDNLVPGQRRRGIRECLTCQRGRNNPTKRTAL